MGLLDGLMGNASEIDPAEANRGFSAVLVPGGEEAIEKAYHVFRDSYLFTNRRLILVDRQGLTGKKVEYHSIPYSKITHFSIETAGSFDLDAELKIWISGMSQPIQKKFNKQLSIYELQSVLAKHIVG